MCINGRACHLEEMQLTNNYAYKKKKGNKPFGGLVDLARQIIALEQQLGLESSMKRHSSSSVSFNDCRCDCRRKVKVSVRCDSRVDVIYTNILRSCVATVARACRPQFMFDSEFDNRDFY